MRAGLRPDEVGEVYTEGIGDKKQVGEAWVPLAGFISLDGATLHTDEVTELLLRQADSATGIDEALAQVSAAGDGPLGQWGSSERHYPNGHPQVILSQYPNGRT